MARAPRPSMKATRGCSLLFSIVVLSSFSSSSFAVSDIEASLLAHRQLHETSTRLEIEPHLKFDNDRLKNAYISLQAWKKAIYSDPKNVTGNWLGPDVCSYTGVFCAPARDDPNCSTVAGIDLNEGDIAGYLPPELESLCDLGMFHLNSNRFCGIIPSSMGNIKCMNEFDISNNRFVGPFPSVVLAWPDLKYLDLRFNDFDGSIPPELFTKNLDAVFLNNNRFTGFLPDTIGNSTASVVTFANNGLSGCIPSSIACMPNVNEFIFKGNKMGGCFPQDLGRLANVTVFDMSDNCLSGEVPSSVRALQVAEVIDVSNNKLTGCLPEEICTLPCLTNLTVCGNYFTNIPASCLEAAASGGLTVEDAGNCLPDRPNQRPAEECEAAARLTVDCSRAVCTAGVEHQVGGPAPAQSPASSMPELRSPPQPVPCPPEGPGVTGLPV